MNTHCLLLLGVFLSGGQQCAENDLASKSLSLNQLPM